ncbi:unnamed protein product [Wickerhamomyces anomalus]
MSFNSPFWDFFDNINDEVDQFNRLLASNGYDDRVRVSPSSTKAVTQGNEKDQQAVTKSSAPKKNERSLITMNYTFQFQVLKKDKINLDFNADKNQVTVSGEIPAHTDDKNLKVNERSSGKFERHISLPSSPKLDENNIKANYANGVLTLKIPKLSKEKSNTRRIEISSSETWGSDDSAESKQ